MNINNKFLEWGSILYILNNKEEAMLKVIVKNTRVDYFRKNKNILKELSLEEEVLYSQEKMEENLENKMDMEIQAEKLECIFRDEILSKIAGALTYTEKLVLSLYYIENKSDEEISNILFLTKSGITKKRNRALEKIRREFEKRRHI